MMIVEDSLLPVTALPMDAFRAHLRLGTGFAEDTLQDEVLEGFLRASLAAIEARTGKALIQRAVLLRSYGWDHADAQGLGLAPVVSVETVQIFDRSGAFVADIDEDVRLEMDAHMPMLRPLGLALPSLPSGGYVQIGATVGYGADWLGVPADLQQAVFLLAAHFYEYRHDMALGSGCMPFGVTSLLERYRPMRLGLGLEAAR